MEDHSTKQQAMDTLYDQLTDPELTDTEINRIKKKLEILGG